jgi:hypothetical protein
MDGSSLSLTVIPIVVMAVLATWLIIVYHAASHPLWRHQQARPHPDTQPTAQPTALPARQQPGHGSTPHRRAA